MKLVIALATAAAIALAMCAHEPRPTVWSVAGELPACDGFDFPVGAPEAEGYYDAQPFGNGYHLGSDWNGNGGGDTDLGDPVYATANGVVIHTRDHGRGWGNVVRIVHACGVESLYAHFEDIEVPLHAVVRRGQRIGTIGTAHGVYKAHLHFEIRDRPMPLGGGYAADTTGYVDPTAFIRAHRP